MEIKLSECVEFLDEKRIPLSANERKTLAKIYPYYGAQGIIDYIDDYLFDGEYILVAEDGNNLKTVNEPIATWATGRFWVNNHAHILGAKEGFNLRYIYYLLNSMNLRGLITGSAQPKLNQQNLRRLVLRLPDKKEQDEIASVLTSIDNKIDNNQAVLTMLQSLLKYIYDYWFIQFEFPNKYGHPYKNSGGKMVWNAALKKEIPYNWQVVPLKECIQHITTGLNPRKNFVLGHGDIKYITVKNLTANGTISWDSYDVIDEKARKLIHNRSEVGAGDILFASIEPLGRCYLVKENPQDWAINESIFSIRPDPNKITAEYLYMLFRSEAFVRQAENSSTGSVFNGIRMNVLEKLPVLLPDVKTLETFSRIVANTTDMAYCLEKEIEELIDLRNFLLPLLMKGQLTFREKEA